MYERGLTQQNVVHDRIEAGGGTVHNTAPNGFILEATVTPAQLASIVHWNEVAFVDQWSPVEFDMNTVREATGADYVEAVGGYTGEGVRPEVADANVDMDHPDWSPEREPIIHGTAPTGPYIYHGTATFGIVFGDGSSDPPERKTRGMLPDAQGIFADADDYLQPVRDMHTCELVASNCLAECGSSDAHCPYHAVFQSNSWGTVTTFGLLPDSYTGTSRALDDILLHRDILVLHSMGNSGCRCSRVEGWAKNVVTVSAVDHQDTAELVDDVRHIGVNYGPAYGGRITPDLVHFGDDTIFTSEDCPPNPCAQLFGDTSASTPIVAGHFGLLFQMWADDPDGDNRGVFDNPPTDPDCDPEIENCVFKNRPHAATAKALMINTARQYCFTSEGNCDPYSYHEYVTRDAQGWGLADVGKLYALRHNFVWIDDEDTVLDDWLGGCIVASDLPPGVAALKATLVYTDPPGDAGASPALVNDLTLRVWVPSGDCYFGNHGLTESNWSAPSADCDSGTSPDVSHIDNVENVSSRTRPRGRSKLTYLSSRSVQTGTWRRRRTMWTTLSSCRSISTATKTISWIRRTSRTAHRRMPMTTAYPTSATRRRP